MRAGSTGRVDEWGAEWGSCRRMRPLVDAAMSPPDPSPDVVTELQEQASRVGGMLFNFVGALQRDAPPASVAGEALVESRGPSVEV